MSNPNPYVGRTVALTRCPARLVCLVGEPEDVLVSGLWDVLEFEGEDREVGIFGESFVLGHRAAFGDDDGRLVVTVEPYALIEQIDPAAHMAELEFEREHKRNGEREAETDANAVHDSRYGHPVEGIVRVPAPEIPGVPAPAFPSIRGGEA